MFQGSSCASTKPPSVSTYQHSHSQPWLLCLSIPSPYLLTQWSDPHKTRAASDVIIFLIHLDYSLGMSIGAGTRSWEGLTWRLKFWWFGDAVFLMRGLVLQPFTCKINPHILYSSHWNKWNYSQQFSAVLARMQVTSRNACISILLSIFNHTGIFLYGNLLLQIYQHGAVHVPRHPSFAHLVTMPPAVFGMLKHLEHCTTTTQIEQPLFCP